MFNIICIALLVLLGIGVIYIVGQLVLTHYHINRVNKLFDDIPSFHETFEEFKKDLDKK